MTVEKKMTVQLICAVGLLIVASCVTIAGWCVTPVGEIPDSNLVYYAESLSFIGALMGFDYHYKNKYMPKEQPEAEKNNNN